MKRICAVVMAAFLAASGADAQIFWWNLENYFDTADDPATADEDFTPGGLHRWNKGKYKAKRNLIAKTIIASSGRFNGRMPCLIGLCEVENRAVLKALTEDTPLAKAGYRILHRDSPDPRGIDVALLYDPARVRLLDIEYITIPEFATREILYAKVAIGRGGQYPDTLHIFVNHWPSKYSGARASEERRLAVSTALLHKLDSLHNADSSAAVLLMGDFNATPGEPSVQRLTTEGGLRNISPETGGTIRFKGKWEMIDQMLASPSAASVIGQAEVFSPAFILEDDKTFMGTKPRRTHIGPRYNGGASDHLPLVARILGQE